MRILSHGAAKKKWLSCALARRVSQHTPEKRAILLRRMGQDSTSCADSCNPLNRRNAITVFTVSSSSGTDLLE
jgi:hypothetical protein